MQPAAASRLTFLGTSEWRYSFCHARPAAEWVLETGMACNLWVPMIKFRVLGIEGLRGAGFRFPGLTVGFFSA